MSKFWAHILDKIQEAKEQQLKKLDLSSSSVTSEGNKLISFPKELLKLDHLEELDLTDNSLTYVPTAVSKLRNLKILVLDGNPLGGYRRPTYALPAALENLEELSLQGCGLTSIPEGLSRMQNLKSLDLSSNKITVITESLSSLRKLKSLD